jgi:ABC-type Fe3+/spermidine/putrescine transport system ATPase subunit
VRVELRGLRVVRGHRTILDGVDLELEPGALRLLVGSSGAGKTTLLRVVAGLDVPDSGCLWLDGELVSRPGDVLVAPHRRGLAMTFQEDALWPHLSVWSHLGFGRRRPRRERAEEAERAALLAFVGLTGREQARPAELSGGERQLLSIARALSLRPRLLLLDEPLAQVDLRARRRLARGLVAFLAERSITTLWVTHHPEELSFLEGQASWLCGGKLEGPFANGELLRLLEQG